jgi:hypothetical protein
VPITINATQGQGNSVNPTGSGVSGTDITLIPRVQNTETQYVNVYKNVCAQVSGVNGITPTFVVPFANGTGMTDWGTGETPFFSYDGLTWTLFGNAPVVSGANLRMTHTSAFTGNDVWFARDKRENTFALSNWIAGLNTTYPGRLTNLSGGSNWIVDTYSTQTDELGRTVAAAPLLGFRIGNRGKPLALLTSGVHAGEDRGTSIYRYSVEFLLGSATEAITLCNAFDFVSLPVVNAPGRDGGHSRGAFQYTNTTFNDLNRHFSDSSFLFETVTKPRAVLITELAASGTPKWCLDYHTTGTAITNECGYYDGIGGDATLFAQWITAMNARLVAVGMHNMTDLGAAPSGTLLGWAAATGGFPLSTVLETRDIGINYTNSQLQQIGQAAMLAMYDLLIAGDFGPYVATGTPFARRRV